MRLVEKSHDAILTISRSLALALLPERDGRGTETCRRCLHTLPPRVARERLPLKLETFGAFVRLDGYRKNGLVHCSQMAPYRVEDVSDVCRLGDTVWVKVRGMGAWVHGCLARAILAEVDRVRPTHSSLRVFVPLVPTLYL